jgi:hypothetical protein
MALNVGLDVSFDNIQNWKGIREKAGELTVLKLVGIATGCGPNDRVVGVQVPVGLRIFSCPRHPDRLWGPPSLYRGLFTQG